MIMKNKKSIFVFLILYLVSLTYVYSAKGPGSAPTGSISISPNQTNGGTTSYVAIGKQLTFKAINLSDKDDCIATDDVDDSIKDPDGIKWVIGLGTLSGGNKGSEKVWTAPTTPTSNIALKLEIDDLATAKNTTDDGGFKQVASWNISVVKPNTVQMTQRFENCNVNTYGKRLIIEDRLSYANVNIDWDGILYTELVGDHIIHDDCNLGAFETGGDIITLNSNGIPNGFDSFSFCHVNDTPGGVPNGCSRIFYTQWVVRAQNGAWNNVFKREYTIKGKLDGKPSQIEMSVRIRSYD